MTTPRRCATILPARAILAPDTAMPPSRQSSFSAAPGRADSRPASAASSAPVGCQGPPAPPHPPAGTVPAATIPSLAASSASSPPAAITPSTWLASRGSRG